MKLCELFNLKGKTALVTGGGRGIGKFIAAGLAEAGADLVLASRKLKNLEAVAADLEKSCGVRAFPVECDLAEEAQILRLAETALAKFGKIDILVNNSGATWGAPVLEFPLDKWDYLFQVNVRGVWILSQKIAASMRDRGGGSIINISSIMGFRGVDDSVIPAVAYNSTKAAINLLTKNLAVKLAPYKIRVNAIAPGFFRTDLMAFIGKAKFRKEYEQIINAIPLRRVGDTNDVKGLAVFLASDASSYMTGQIIGLDGGFLAK